MKISGFVITYNSGPILSSCLRSLRFVDELIVLDKSSTDGSADCAARFADKVISVPFSPLPTETRIAALEACSHDFIIFLDHDECLNVEGIRWVKENAATHPADIFRIPKCEYVMGLHDPDAYYWPMLNVRAFRRGKAEFVRTLHEEVRAMSPSAVQFDIPYDTGVRIHNFSHKSVHQWIEKTNRYTDEPDRVSWIDTSMPLEAFARDRITHWLSQSRSRTDTVVAAALLRAVYDIVDRLKLLEADMGGDGDSRFAEVCAELEATYDASPDCAPPAPPTIAPQADRLLRRLLRRFC